MKPLPSTAPSQADCFRRLRNNLDDHMFFYVMLIVTLYIFFFVPQVTNVWMQPPPREISFWSAAGYAAFLSFLVGFYGLSMFVVIRQFPARWVQEWAERFVLRQTARWRAKKWYSPLVYVVALCTWRVPDFCSRWLVWAVSNPKSEKPPTGQASKPHRRLPVAALVFVMVAFSGASALMLGTRSDASRAYPLAGAFCQNMALLSLLAAVWMILAGWNRVPEADVSAEGHPPVGPAAWLRSSARVWGRAEQPGEVLLYFGRLIAWLISTALIGELLWWLASTDWWDNAVSYRLYSIWAIFELLTALVIGGLLIDRWHAASERLPVRQVAVVLFLPLIVWLFSRAMPVSDMDLDSHLTPARIAEWTKMRQKEDGPKSLDWHARSNVRWFEHMNARVKDVPASEPVVFVAASGGGSRAAIFTSLVLETLQRRPAGAERVWADNVVLISSVSGGSLATAYHVARRAPGAPPDNRAAPLLNTDPNELKKWGKEHSSGLIQTHLDDPPEGFPVELFGAYYAKKDAAYFARKNGPNYTTKDKDADSREAVAALENAEEDMNVRLRQAVESIKKKLDTAVRSQDVVVADPKVAAEILGLRKTAEALRTALALLDGYRSLHDPKPDRMGRWVWSSRAFDEMCIDFMAPLTRGAMTPALGRGNALARFWTYRYDWADCTNFSGYHGPLDGGWNFGSEKERLPAVVFNAVDVARGSRLAVGFPPLPSDLWDRVYSSNATREVPRPLNAPVSLARAVRMSSNFPYGFRAMEFQTPARVSRHLAADLMPGGGPLSSKLETIHVLDGGVVDNTGLDTIYELVMALEYHADPRNVDPKNGGGYHARAQELLDDLRQRGVCILEIDAGAKPTTHLPDWRNPFGGIAENSQALENGGYSNADRAKQLYLKEIRRVLTQALDEPGQPPLTGGKTSLGDLQMGLQSTALHYAFQCNHYQPGRGADPAIMTAWALGPRDKAEVVARFLPELGLWERRRDQLRTDIQEGKEAVSRVRAKARVRILQDRIIALSQEFSKIDRELANLERVALQRGEVQKGDLATQRFAYGKAKKLLESLARPVERETDGELLGAWKNLVGQVGDEDKRLTFLEKSPSGDPLKKGLASSQSIAQKSAASYEKILTTLEEAKAEGAKKAAGVMRTRDLLDPQMKYDILNRQIKEVSKKSAVAKP